MDLNTRALMMGAAGAAAGPSYWIATLGSGSGFESAEGVAVDSAGNIYVTGQTQSQGAGNADVIIVKYNSSGVIQWQRSLGNANSDLGYGIATDSSGAIYVAGTTNNGNDNLLTKYNSSGVIQWQRALTGGTKAQGIYYNLYIDSSDNIYACGGLSVFTNEKWFLAKYNSSGTLQWQNQMNGVNGRQISGRDVTVGSNGTIYATGNYSESNYEPTGRLVSYDSSGNLLSPVRAFGGQSTYSNPTPYGIVHDASNALYITGQSNSGAFLSKYDSALAPQWKKRLGSSSNDVTRSIAIDSSGNIYTCGDTYSTRYRVLLAKYDTNGTLQWQRTLDSSTQMSGAGVAVDNAGGVIISGYVQVSGQYDVFVARLKDDGSLTGTYGSFTYAVSSFTDTTASFPDVATTESAASPGHTNSTASLTDAATTFTSTVTQL